MRECIKCGEVTETGERICRKCGTNKFTVRKDSQTVRCPSCGMDSDKDTRHMRFLWGDLRG